MKNTAQRIIDWQIEKGAIEKVIAECTPQMIELLAELRSLHEVAKDCGLSTKFLEGIMDGDRQPTMDVFLKIDSVYRAQGFDE